MLLTFGRHYNINWQKKIDNKIVLISKRKKKIGDGQQCIAVKLVQNYFYII